MAFYLFGGIGMQIGFFDSGVGGITPYYRYHLLKMLPKLKIIYIDADTSNAFLGTKTEG